MATLTDTSDVASRNRIMIPSSCRSGLPWLVPNRQTDVGIELISAGRIAVHQRNAVDSILPEVSQTIRDEFAEDPLENRQDQLLNDSIVQNSVIDSDGRLCLTSLAKDSLIVASTGSRVVVLVSSGICEVWSMDFYMRALDSRNRTSRKLMEKLSRPARVANTTLRSG